MKIQILILALFIMPFFAFSQQIGNKNPGKKQLTNTVVVKKQIHTQPTLVAESETVNIEVYRKANNVPDDFPRYKDTGNSKLDVTKYHDAKQEWIKNNPVRFEKIKHLAL